ncbi:MAG TPA: tetratricopeptide repeat protein [Leptolyngbyaceae cyanobacterium]
MERLTAVLKRTSVLSLLAVLGIWGAVPPAQGQALIPYVLPLDYTRLEEQGLILAQEAVQLAQFQQYGPALERAQLASQMAPGNAQVWSLLGTLYLQFEEVDQAIPALEKAKSLEPNEAGVLFSLGSAYFKKGEYLQAASFIEQGLAIEPSNAGALFDLGNAYFKLKQYQKAITQYEASVRTEPEFWPSVNNIGLVLFEQGKPDDAIARWRSSLEISGDEPEPKLAMAIALYSTGERSESLRLGIEALEQDSRYADVDFLRDNLWGNRMIEAAQQFFQAPTVKALIAQL